MAKRKYKRLHYEDRQTIEAMSKQGSSVTQTQSRVKSMLLKLGVFLVAVGLVKLLVAFILRAREKRGKA